MFIHRDIFMLQLFISGAHSSRSERSADWKNSRNQVVFFKLEMYTALLYGKTNGSALSDESPHPSVVIVNNSHAIVLKDYNHDWSDSDESSVLNCS